MGALSTTSRRPTAGACRWSTRSRPSPDPMSFEDGWHQVEAEAGQLLADELSQQSPVVTGDLAASMTWEDQDERLTVGSRDSRGPIAKYVTRGTSGPYDIYPVNAKALH